MSSSGSGETKLCTSVIQEVKLSIVASPGQLPFSFPQPVAIVLMLIDYRNVAGNNRLGAGLQA